MDWKETIVEEDQSDVIGELDRDFELSGFGFFFQSLLELSVTSTSLYLCKTSLFL